MYLGKYEGRLIRITLKNGKIFEGIGEWYTQGIDNPNGSSSICIGDFELYEPEIASIEAIATPTQKLAIAV